MVVVMVGTFASDVGRCTYGNQGVSDGVMRDVIALVTVVMMTVMVVLVV